jgi:integrase
MKDTTREYYKAMLSTLGREFADTDKLVDVTPQRLLKLADKLKKDERSARTIAGVIATVKRMFVLVTQYLKAQDYPRLHEAKTDIIKVEKPPVDNYKDDFFTAEEVKKLIAAASEPLALAIRIQIETGLRPGNVYSLSFSDIGADGTISINGDDMKSGRHFVTTISAGLKKDLTEHALKHGYRTWLFPSPTNNPALGIDKPVHDMRSAWETAITKSGLSGTPHKLRHSFASIMLANDVPLPMVSELMNHADVGITMKRYGHLEHSKKRDTLAEYREQLKL